MLFRALALVAVLSPPCFMSAQSYSATAVQQDGVEVVRLTDSARNMQVSIAPKIGAIAYEFLINGQNALFYPADSIGEFAKAPRLAGVPLLWPWANRLDRDGFYFEGKFHKLSDDLAPFRRDGSNYPIHGLLAFSDAWKVSQVSADDKKAEVALKLEFSEHPELAGQFPFEHSIELSYILSGGTLEVKFHIQNLGETAMPVSLGFHPYFQVHDAPRDEWSVELPVASVWNLNERLTPTGEKTPTEELFPNRKNMKVSEQALDNVFGDLERDDEGWATFVLKGDKQQVAVEYGPSYDVAVVYAPPGRNFVCFEPMAGITNALNLAHEGRYPDLQTIEAGGEWTGVFRIRPLGF